MENYCLITAQVNVLVCVQLEEILFLHNLIFVAKQLQSYNHRIFSNIKGVHLLRYCFAIPIHFTFVDKSIFPLCTLPLFPLNIKVRLYECKNNGFCFLSL